MGMVGLTFFIALVFLGGSLGIPMGMAPGPEDPLLSRIAPQTCTFYASWSGVQKTDPAANPTEKWMSQPATSAAIVKLRKAYRGYLLKQAKNYGPTAKLTNELLIEAIDAASINPAGMYIDRLEINEKQITFGAAVVISMGDQQDKIQESFQALRQHIEDQDRETRATNVRQDQIELVEGNRMIELASPIDGWPMFISIWGDYVVFGIGDQTFSQVIKNSRTPPPQWLDGIRERLKVERIASVGYMNLDDTKALFKLPFWQMGMGITLDGFIDDVESLGVVSGLDSQGFISRSEIRTGDELHGLLAVIDLEPIPIEFFEDVPANTTVGVATRMSTKKILELVKSTARNAGQEMALNETLGEFQKVTGVSLEDELLDAVGDYIHGYYKLNLNNWDAGWVISIRIEDEMSFPGIFETINRGLKNWIADQDQAKFNIKPHGLHQIYSINTGRNSTSFAWALIDDQWLLARNTVDIEIHLKGQPIKNQYQNDPSVREMFAFGEEHGLGGPVTMTHLNVVHLLEAARPFVAGFLKNEEPVNQDFDFRWSDVPPIDEWVADVRPIFTCVYRTKDGFQLLHRHTYPGSSPPVAAAAFGLAALPERMAEVAVRNNLTRLGRAHLDFEKQHKHFCAAYSVDAQSNPLLSWRVHLLPHLGHAALYKQFHLDEAWDSDHNSQLLEKMPRVYQHPTMKLDPNKTVFLAFSNEDSVIAPTNQPDANPPVGVERAEVEDRPEDVALLVELNRDQQVFWTKPNDVPKGAKDFSSMTRRIRRSDYFSILLLDGSVHQLRWWNADKMIRDLSKKSDGKRVQLPQEWFFR